MRHTLLLLVLLPVCFLFGQLSSPNVEDIFGGRIIGIAGYAYGTDSSRIFITTESANSGFYASAYLSGGRVRVSRFTVLPSMNAAAGLGSSISRIYGHQSSDKLFYINGNVLYSTNISAVSGTIIAHGVSAFLIKGDYLFYVSGSELHFGTLNSSGTFSENAASPLTVSGVGGNSILCVNPSNSKLYVFSEGTTPTVIRSTSTYTGFSGTTAFDILPVSGLVAANTWAGFGISPTGRMFFGGSDGVGKVIAYTDNDTNYTSFQMGIDGVHGPNFAFSGDRVYFAAVYSTTNGNSGTWQKFGDPGGYETHPNDGPVFQDALYDSLCLMTTDQGIGASKTYGSGIYEIDRGVEAVQVNDFDMTTDKTTAWLASKAGIRKVSTYTTTPSWSRAMWPNGDGSPYYSAAMKHGDTNTVYVGNVRVKKTTDGGTTWNQIFTAENAPYNLSGHSFIDAIEVSEYDNNVVFAGYNDEQGGIGGLFYSHDQGSNWNQILISATSIGPDINVTDVIFNIEGTDTVAYVSAKYPNGYSVYRLIKSGATWTVSRDMTAANTSTGTAIVVTINDLCKSAAGDTIFAAGTDAGSNHPVIYYKPILTSNKWTPITVTGLTTLSGKQATAVTIGGGMVYIAVNNEIYCWVPGYAAWTLGYSYPNGTEINVMFYDDLLVGTGTGLYGHWGTVPTPSYVLNTTLFIEGLWNGTSQISDSIRAEIRSSGSPYSVLATASALLNSNGQASFVFNGLANGTPYNVVFRHRNSIETWTATTSTFSSYESLLDMSTSASSAYGDNLKLKNGKYCIYGGDINGDGLVDLTDLMQVDNASRNFIRGYVPEDVNGDSLVDISDLQIVDNNSAAFIFVKSPISPFNKPLDASVKQTIPKEFSIQGNYPNPFNPSTRIMYTLPKDGPVTFTVYSVTGAEVLTQHFPNIIAGTNFIHFDASHFSSGVYFYTLRFDGKTLNSKMILTK